MPDINIAFCRALLAQAHELVREHAPGVKLRSAWVYGYGREQWEFHGPNEFYWNGRAGNAYHARYKGWMAWLAKYHSAAVS